jgi:hypothetical protein
MSSTPGASSTSFSPTSGVGSASTPTFSNHGSSTTPYIQGSSHGTNFILIPAIVVPVVVFVLLIVSIWCCFAACRRTPRRRNAEEAVGSDVKSKDEGQSKDKKVEGKVAEKTDKKREQVEDDDDSIRKVPPPNYTDALGDYIIQAAEEKGSMKK